MKAINLKSRTLWFTFLITTVWINFSEVLRYFLVVRPAIQVDLAMVPNVVPMDLGIFLIWGVWDTILTCMLMWFVWLCSRQFQSKLTAVALAGSSMWISFFLLFWLGMVNMNLATISLAAIALPWALVEMLIAAWITHWCFQKFA
jgi:hypothetical protein